MLLEHHLRVGLHLKRINDGTCSSPNYMSNYISRDELYFQLSRDRSKQRTRTTSIRAIAWRNIEGGRRVERLKGSGNALSRFPAAGHPKNLVPSPRNDNRMDECALDLLSPPNFPVLQENFLLRARISRSCFFPSFFESSSRYSLSILDLAFPVSRTCLFVDR